ncbi:MAG TPA: MraY family glycosyltransferase [Clostridia bacterium]|nr:MraY family glycosyltransferase [Clostridia bacterium]
MEKLTLALILAFSVTLVLTPWVRKKAFEWGAVDKPDSRKVHSGIMPRMGGLAVYVSFLVAVICTQELTTPVVGLLVGITLITALGIVDDIKGVPAKLKLLGQIVAAASIVPFGISVDFITNPFSQGIIYLGLLGVPLTILWVVTVTNAINLIDGLDGLAAGVSCVAALTLAAVAGSQVYYEGMQSQGEIMFLALILAASLLGFLKYNFNPARIFLGDSGSMMLGFTLSALSVMGLAKSATVISLIIPIIILGVPLFDVALAVVRRFFNRQPIFAADKDHVHHRLLAAGMGHRKAVVAIYCVSIVLGLSAFILTLVTTNQAMLLLVALSLVILFIANKAGIIGKKVKGKYQATGTEDCRQRSTKM